MSIFDERFLPFCEKNGIELLREDKAFIRLFLMRMPKKFHSEVLRNYLNKWKEGMRKSDNDIQKSSSGRREANSWLLKAKMEDFIKNPRR